MRSSPLWKEPRLLKWLQTTCEVAASSLDDSSEEDVRFGEKLWLVGGWPKGVAPSGVIRGAFLSGKYRLNFSKRKGKLTHITIFQKYLPSNLIYHHQQHQVHHTLTILYHLQHPIQHSTTKLISHHFTPLDLVVRLNNNNKVKEEEYQVELWLKL